MRTLEDIRNAIEDIYGDKYYDIRKALLYIVEYLEEIENEIPSDAETMDEIMEESL